MNRPVQELLALLVSVPHLRGDEPLPQSVEFGEVATSRRATDATGTVSFAAPDGATVDQGSLAIHGKVVAYQARHKVTYEAALDAVLAGAA